MKVLGIESSCDETAAAVVEDGSVLLSNVVATSLDLHIEFGGVVPEIAARSHIESITPVIKQALKQANCTWDDIDAIAVTYGPGLGGSLLVGVLAARTLAILKQKPLYAINHVEAHVYVNFLTSTDSPAHKIKASTDKAEDSAGSLLDKTKPAYTLPLSPPTFPLLALIVSGGHSQLVLFNDFFDYKLLGQTRDDAVGEAFDKVAKILGLPYPGGPSITKAALGGNPHKYSFPKAKLDNKYDFSFSGLKTAVLRTAQSEIAEDYSFPSHKLSERLTEAQKADFAASFQCIAVETLVDKLVLAAKEYSPNSVVVAGGVAANQELRKQIDGRLHTPVVYTDPKLCTDNGAMIAAAGCFAAKKSTKTADPFDLEITPSLSM